MNEFFGTSYSKEDLQRRRHSHRASISQNVQAQAQAQAHAQMMMSAQPQSNGDTMGMMGGDTLDDIIMQNSQDIQRRQSFPGPFQNQDINRSQSMVQFGSNDGNLNGFQFGTSTEDDAQMRRQSMSGLEIGRRYGDASPGMNIMEQQMSFSPSIQTTNNLSIDTNSPYTGVTADMVSGMMSYQPLGMEGIGADDPNGMSMYSPTNFSPYGGGSIEPMSAGFMMPSNMPETIPPNGPSIVPGVERNDNEMMHGMSSLMTNGSLMSPSQTLRTTQNTIAFNSSLSSNIPPLTPNDDSPLGIPASIPNNLDSDDQDPAKVEIKPNYQGIYSSSGFDMLGALIKVATRKNPEIDIGKVDMSCAFVVCDITQTDCPIVYVSDIFERLTGYTKFEVLGRNCRFLQSPEGKIQVGVRREFVDNDSVYYLKNRIAAKQEAQRSLINYRKGGQPFMNLLTMIPITGENSEEIKYYVGFQVDLVEKPTSVEGKNASGLYTVDYSQGMLPRYVWQPPEGARLESGGQTISRDDVATVLSSINSSTESELTKRMWDKVLLENTDDVVHVLSLKGLFLYLSPSSRKILEYDASELVGTALSSVCHPSDIVPVTRELKDTSTGASVNVVFRIRRKKSGYTWFESHGSLCVEQGKGRKCIILVGRERPVYALARHDIEAAGGIGESEMWTKLSTSGMFLFVSANIRILLDRSPDDLIGTSIQQLMRAESRKEFGRSLEKARTGKRITHRHDIFNRRGLVLQAQTTLYPGDACEGQKPTFLVAQTRLLKTSSRNIAAAHAAQATTPKAASSIGKGDRASDVSSPFPSGVSISPIPIIQGEAAPPSTTSVSGPVTHAGSAGLPIGSQDDALASEDNIFDELKTTRCTSWQFELRQMEKSNRLLQEELASLISNKKKRKRRKGADHLQRDCANCHTLVTPEWRRGPSGQRDLCNSCGLRWAKQVGRVSPRNSARGDAAGSKHSKESMSPAQSSPLANDAQTTLSSNINSDITLNKAIQVDGKSERTERGPAQASTPTGHGGRTTQKIMPAHKPSVGYRDGGDRGITKIDEANEGAG